MTVTRTHQIVPPGASIVIDREPLAKTEEELKRLRKVEAEQEKERKRKLRKQNKRDKVKKGPKGLIQINCSPGHIERFVSTEIVFDNRDNRFLTGANETVEREAKKETGDSSTLTGEILGLPEEVINEFVATHQPPTDFVGTPESWKASQFLKSHTVNWRIHVPTYTLKISVTGFKRNHKGGEDRKAYQTVAIDQIWSFMTGAESKFDFSAAEKNEDNAYQHVFKNRAAPSAGSHLKSDCLNTNNPQSSSASLLSRKNMESGVATGACTGAKNSDNNSGGDGGVSTSVSRNSSFKMTFDKGADTSKEAAAAVSKASSVQFVNFAQGMGSKGSNAGDGENAAGVGK